MNSSVFSSSSAFVWVSSSLFSSVCTWMWLSLMWLLAKCHFTAQHLHRVGIWRLVVSLKSRFGAGFAQPGGATRSGFVDSVVLALINIVPGLQALLTLGLTRVPVRCASQIGRINFKITWKNQSLVWYEYRRYIRGRNCIKNNFKIIGPVRESDLLFRRGVPRSAHECCLYGMLLLFRCIENCINVLIDRMCCCAGWICATICLI